MKLWHLAAILLVLGIGYVLIARPTVPPKTSSAQSTVSNSLFTLGVGLVTAGANYFGSNKPSANSALPSNDVATPGLSVSGNTIVNSSGEAQQFGPGTYNPSPE